MAIESIPARFCTIYQGRGAIAAHDLPPKPTPDFGRPMTRAADVTLAEIMCLDLVCAQPDLEIESVVELMVDNHLGCVPVVDERRQPVGMITKYDIVEHLNAYLQSASNDSPLPADLAPRTAEEVMMPIALTLAEDSTVADAALMMTLEDLHHVLVVSRSGALVGVVSTKDIVTWLVRSAGTPFTSDR